MNGQSRLSQRIMGQAFGGGMPRTITQTQFAPTDITNLQKMRMMSDLIQRMGLVTHPMRGTMAEQQRGAQEDYFTGMAGLSELKHREMMERAEQEHKYTLAQEAQKHQFNTAEAIQEFQQKLAQMPTVDYLRSTMQMRKMEGMDTSDIEKDLAEAIIGTWQLYYPMITGGVPTEEAIKAIRFIPDETLRQFGVRLSIAREAEKKLGFQREELKVREREAKTREIKELREMAEFQREVATEDEKKYEEDRKTLIGGQKDNVKWAMDYLKSLGVRPSEVGERMRQDILAGKVYLPLSAENQGIALSILMRLQQKLAKSIPLTDDEDAYVSEVINTAQVEEAGVPATPGGITTGGEADLAALTAEILRKAGEKGMMVSPEQAEAIARQLLGIR